MAVTTEMWQHCMVEVHKMNAENLAQVMKQQNDALTELVGSARGTSSLKGTRGIGRPVVFKEDEGKYTEWKAKLMAYLRISTPRSDEMIRWVAAADSMVTEEDVKRAYPKNQRRNGRATPRVVTIRAPTMSKGPRTSWRT